MEKMLSFVARVRFAFLRSRMHSILHRVDKIEHGQFSSMEAMWNRSRDPAIKAQLDKYWAVVSRDPEIWTILQHYRITRSEIEELRKVFQRCGIPSAEGMSLPFPIEYAAHLLRTHSTDRDQELWLHHCVCSAAEGFANEAQRDRYAEIFGEANIRSFGSSRRVPQDYTEAARWYRKAADQGDADAQFTLGRMYGKGEGVAQDHEEAAKWSRKAAEQGHAGGQNNLGVACQFGLGVPQDYEEAAKWYRKAAEQGNTNAQVNLGALYDKGEGMPQDYVEADMWLSLAASHSRAEHQEQLSIYREAIAAKMTPQQIAEAKRLAREWKPKGDEAGTA